MEVILAILNRARKSQRAVFNGVAKENTHRWDIISAEFFYYNRLVSRLLQTSFFLDARKSPSKASDFLQC
ncbi:hypothetical protein IQ66_20805 [Leptospira borgpetersenii serovar Ballum]|nr:hypothetical protein IQ66_20805 [Leptospira borgpetersenii serovar Ballum]